MFKIQWINKVHGKLVRSNPNVRKAFNDLDAAGRCLQAQFASQIEQSHTAMSQEQIHKVDTTLTLCRPGKVLFVTNTFRISHTVDPIGRISQDSTCSAHKVPHSVLPQRRRPPGSTD